MEELEVNIDSITSELATALESGEDFCLLESGERGGEVILGIGAHSAYVAEGVSSSTITDFQSWLDDNQGSMGWISYDLKNIIADLDSNNPDPIHFPTIGFFKPKKVLKAQGVIRWQDALKQPGESSQSQFSHNGNNSKFEPNPLISREEYLEKVGKIKRHIQLGDVYELNFCQAFTSQVQTFDAFQTYAALSDRTKAPMSAMISLNGFQILSGSPERFLRRRGKRIISQPIKGTRPRGNDLATDAAYHKELGASSKDKSENVMIADLVRNDLSKVATRGSVKADELFGVYSFPTVHQMISTISAELRDDVNFSDILHATFPMGSMTGAPKISAMRLIEKYESFKRGPYSGTLGLYSDHENFDFNVLIRSIFHNANTGEIGVFAGGAITAESDPEEEYEESMLKARAMLDALR